MKTAVSLRKVQTGLWGTNRVRLLHEHEFLYCNHGCQSVEVCVDGYTDRDGWYIRYVCDHGHFSDTLGEWFPTLRAAKEYFYEHPDRIG